MSVPTVTVLNAGLRVPSSSRLLAERIADAVRDRLPGADLEIVDLRDHAHPMMDALLTGFPTGVLAEVLERVAASDALVVVTPTFQATYSGLFKTFVDLVDKDALRGTPVLLAATGGSERHSLMIDHALRPLFAYLGAEPLVTGIFAATSDFGGGEGLQPRIDRAAGELASRLGTGGVSENVAETEAEVVPFEELLARYSA
ncbi:MAG TPA: CE1759 family FMN reductase [Propionibacteriaceae bacterium]|nr:CE1759 family FMN reductase [Propionibacteriaceae bacterium]